MNVFVQLVDMIRDLPWTVIVFRAVCDSFLVYVLTRMYARKLYEEVGCLDKKIEIMKDGHRQFEIQRQTQLTATVSLIEEVRAELKLTEEWRAKNDEEFKRALWNWDEVRRFCEGSVDEFRKERTTDIDALKQIIEQQRRDLVITDATVSGALEEIVALNGHSPTDEVAADGFKKKRGRPKKISAKTKSKKDG